MSTSFDRITRDARKMNGQPCIRGMRITVERVVQLIALYPDQAELFREYPELTPEDLQQALLSANSQASDDEYTS